MKTMKVIDLLNKIANGEEVPKEIEYTRKHYYLTNNHDIDEFGSAIGMFNLNDEILILDEDYIEDTPTLKELFQQEINNENEILSSRLESDTKLDIIKNYITSEEAIDNFKTIESRDEWLKVHDFILDIIDNYKLQKENGEVIVDTPKEDKKIEKIKPIERKPRNIDNVFLKDKLNEIIKVINGE